MRCDFRGSAAVALLTITGVQVFLGVIAYVARTLTTAPASLFDAPLFHPPFNVNR
jgi:energy-coupling factor transporter transmembrane protein EcfT